MTTIIVESSYSLDSIVRGIPSSGYPFVFATRSEGWTQPVETVAAESCPLFRVLRHRASSSPICLSEEIRKSFALSRVFLLSSRGKSVLLVKKKASSRSGILLSMYVVLKTRHVNPNIHVRRYYSHVRSPNLSATRPQLLSLRGATVSSSGHSSDQYWSRL